MGTLTHMGATALGNALVDPLQYRNVFLNTSTSDPTDGEGPTFTFRLFDDTDANADETASGVSDLGSNYTGSVEVETENGVESISWDGTDDVLRVTFDLSNDPIDTSDDTFTADSYAIFASWDSGNLQDSHPDEGSLLWFDSLDETIDLDGVSSVTLENPDPGIEFDATLG